MDITERKKATDKLIRLSMILKMIARVNQDMSLIKDRNELLQSICNRIVVHPYKMVWIGLCDEPTKTVVPAAQAGFEEGYLDSIKVTYDDSEYGRGPTGTTIRTNKPCVVRSTAKDPTYEPWRKEALKRGYRSSAAIPIVSGERAIGALNVYSEEEDAFGDEEIGLLEELAHDISTGLRAIDEENKRIEAEKRLKTYQAKLKSLASELALAEERERHRIAAGIHDGIGQKLALAKMELQLLARPPGKSRIPASLDSVCARIDEAIKDAHSLTFELSNPALYDLSFEAAIELWLLEQIQKKHGIKCTVIADEQALPLDENSKIVLFRALRELAVNAVKHAKATALTVTIEKLENSVQITCKDDGLGFAPPEAGALPRDVGGFGLFNIKERLEYLGGGMKLQSAPGRGTLITLSLPLKRQNDAGADEGRQ
jgi:signal transduction histidine kinase